MTYDQIWAFVVCLLIASSGVHAEVDLWRQVHELYPQRLERQLHAPVSDCRECSESKGEQEERRDDERWIVPFADIQFRVSDAHGTQQIHGTPLTGFPLPSFFDWLKRSRGISAEQFMLMSEEEQREKLTYYAERFAMPLEEQVSNIDNSLILLEIAGMASLGKSEDEILQHLAGRMQGKSFADKLRFLVGTLSVYDQNYDRARIDRNDPASKGRVSTAAMLQSALLTLQGQDIESVPDAGVCRDMHQSVLRMARAMGMEESYGVSYVTKGAAHLNMVVSDPTDRTRTYVINYGQLFVNQGQSASDALSQQGIEDVGLGYSIWGPDNRPVMYIPSERGSILNIVTGGNDGDFDPAYHHQSTISQVGIRTPLADIRFFVADNTEHRDEHISGVAANTRIQYSEILYGEFGIVAYHANRNFNDDNSLTSTGVLVRTEQGAEKELLQSDIVTVDSYANLHLTASVFHNKFTHGDDKGKWNGDANGSLAIGLNARGDLGPLRLRTNLDQRISAHSADVQDGAQGMAFYYPVTSLHQEVSFDLGEVLRVDNGVGLYYRPMQDKHYVSADALSSLTLLPTQTRASVGVQGALHSAMPLWVPGSERKGFVQVKQPFMDQFYLVGQGEMSMDFPGQGNAFVGLGGHF